MFGPDDLLYIGTGDGGSGGDPENRAQNLESPLGKILRIDPRRSGSSAYRSPRVEPVRGRAPGATRSTRTGCATRGASRSTARTGDLYIGDVGPELARGDRLRAAGAGARGATTAGAASRAAAASTTRATARTPSAPVLELRALAAASARSPAASSSRDPAVPDLAGRYVYGDYCAGRLAQLPHRGRQGDRTTAGSACRVASLSSFGEDARGRVYATSLDGPVYRLRSR